MKAIVAALIMLARGASVNAQTKAEIQGSDDKINPMDRNAALLIKALPQGRLEVLDGYGHLPEVEAPDTVNRMLREFFGG